jgi:hypothetical protein
VEQHFPEYINTDKDSFDGYQPSEFRELQPLSFLVKF